MKSGNTKSEGNVLLNYMKQNGLTKNEISGELNMTLAMFSHHCRNEILAGSFKARLNGIGIVPFETEQHKGESLLDYINELKEEVRLLTEVVDLQKQFITHVTQNCRQGYCLNFMLENRKS